MIPVTLHNIFANGERGEAWLVLAEESGKHGLPIFVGSDVRVVIMELFRKKPQPRQSKDFRPLTYSFFASIMQAVGAELTEVQVVEVVDNTFRAVAVVRARGSEYRIDAKPSDAVALAACMNRPIYVTEELMAVAAKPLGAEGRPPDVPQGFVSMRALWSDDAERNAP